MPTMTLDTTNQTPTQSILQRSVCLLLQCGRLGNRRKVELASVEMTKNGEKIDARATDELGARKRLFAEADLRPARAVINGAKQFVQSIALDGGSRIFGAGAHLIPLLSVRRANERLARFQEDLAVPVELLIAQLPRLIEERRSKLGPSLFNIADYPTADRVRGAYRISWSYVKFGAPEHLEEVDAAAYEQARADWDGRLNNAYQDVIVGLRESASLVMRELADRLRPDANGKPKALQPTALRDLQELLEQLPVLNSVGEDSQLAEIVARVGGYARGLTPATLKENASIRGMLLAQAEEAASELETLVSTGRTLSFGDTL